MAIRGPDGNPMNLDPDTGELLSAPVDPDQNRADQTAAQYSTDKDKEYLLGEVEEPQRIVQRDGDQGGLLGELSTNQKKRSKDGGQGRPLGELDLQTVPSTHLQEPARVKTGPNTVQGKVVQSSSSVKVVVKLTKKDKQMWDLAEARKLRPQSKVSGVNDSMIQICKKIKNLPFSKHKMYRR